jgi:ubiquinone biosynthesis protein
MDRMAENGIRLAPETISEIGQSEARSGRWGRIALVVIAVVAVALALKLLF